MAYPFQKQGKIGKKGVIIGVKNAKPVVTFKNQQKSVELRQQGASLNEIQQANRGE